MPNKKIRGYEPMPEDDLRMHLDRGRSHWNTPEKLALALGLVSGLEGLGTAYARRWIVREHVDAIMVHGRGPGESGLPQRDMAFDSAVKAGFRFRILPPENGLPAGTYLSVASVSSDFQYAEGDRAFAYAQHMLDAIAAFREFGLLPVETDGSRSSTLFELRLSDPLRQVPAMVKAYLDLPARGLNRATRSKTVPYAQTAEDYQEPRIPRNAGKRPRRKPSHLLA